MTPPANTAAPASFTRDDLDNLVTAHRQKRAFERFLLTRFAAYTRSTRVRDESGRVVEPITDPFARTNAGYGRWMLPARWMDMLIDVLDRDEPYVHVDHYIDNDRGPGSTSHQVKVPLSFIFGDTERAEKYAEYLRLKAEFEPETPAHEVTLADTVTARPPQLSGRATQPVAEVPPEWSTAKRLDAARWLWVNSALTAFETARQDAFSAKEDVDLAVAAHMVNPEHREETVKVYREAWRLTRHSREDIRYRVQQAAATLGLTHADLDEAADVTSPDAPHVWNTPERLTAATLLWRNSSLRRNGSVTAADLVDPAHRDSAAQAYREALDALKHYGTEDAQWTEMHDAADVLGLTTADLADKPRQCQTKSAFHEGRLVTNDKGVTLCEKHLH